MQVNPESRQHPFAVGSRGLVAALPEDGCWRLARRSTVDKWREVTGPEEDMDPDRYRRIVDMLAKLPTSRGRAFFASHGLGEAWDRPGKGWGREQRVNEALAEADRLGILTQVLDDAESEFGGPTSTRAEDSSSPGLVAGRTRRFIGQAGIEWRVNLDELLGPPGGIRAGVRWI